MNDITPVETYPLAEDPARFINRELSWLAFNTRVMEEASNPNHPLLERLRFLSISASNLDEFYMVRVAGLRQQERSGVTTPSQDGRTPTQQLQAIRKQSRKLMEEQTACWIDLRGKLADAGVEVAQFSNLSKSEAKKVETYFDNNILPLLTPLAIDPAHPFPFVPNLGFGLVLQLRRKSDGEMMRALIIAPSHVSRFMQVTTKIKKAEFRYVMLEDMLKSFGPRLFPDFDTLDMGLFRVTRDSDMEIDEEAEDLVQHFEFLLKKRRRGQVIRLTMENTISEGLQNFLIDSFEAWAEEVFLTEGVLGMADLAELVDTDKPELKFKSFEPRFPERIREHDGNCFSAISEKDILVHHPYEEFSVMIQFLEQAANDPDVVAIKQTLYRTGTKSPIVQALIEAAENGKNVTALVELKARFDEETNLRWARDLERAGAHVVYGFIDYKTHAKVSLVIRREGTGLKSYAHLGTGNYHPVNAKIYTDLALFTADQALCRDVNRLFNYVTSYSRPDRLEKMAISPINTREKLLEKIEAEINHAINGRQASIWAKMNSLVDNDIIDALYRASQAGVKIDLVVRGICCLRPGIDGFSENIRVKSIVGRFLEHSRIICFGNGEALPNKNALIYFSSADWMPRNLDRRVEALVPIENPTVRRQIMNQIMVANLNDNLQSWVLNEDGTYDRIAPGEGQTPFSAHEYFMSNPSLSGRGKALKYSRPTDLKRFGKSKS